MLQNIDTKLLNNLNKLQRQLANMQDTILDREQRTSNAQINEDVCQELLEMIKITENDCVLFVFIRQELLKLLKDLHIKDERLGKQARLMQCFNEKLENLLSKMKLNSPSLLYNDVSLDNCTLTHSKLENINQFIKEIGSIQKEVELSIKKVDENATQYNLLNWGSFENKSLHSTPEEPQEDLDELDGNAECCPSFENVIPLFISTDASIKQQCIEDVPNMLIQDLEKELEKALDERDIERKKRNQEIGNLKETIFELEKALKNAQIRGENLQNAVDLYENSINVLEACEERSKIELHKNIQLVCELQDKFQMVKHEYGISHNKIQKLTRHIKSMQDEILDLEVENFGYTQDLEMLDIALSKYQYIFRNHKECCSLKNEIEKLKLENERTNNMNIALSQKLVGMESELQEASKNESELDQLKQSFAELKKANEELEQKLQHTCHQLGQEKEMNEVDEDRIDNLSHTLERKSAELVYMEEKCICTQNKLDATIDENNQLQNETAMLMNKIGCYEEQSVLSEERTDYCQKELDNCNKNLCLLNEKLSVMKDLLHQKDDQYSQLETYFYVQTNALDCTKKLCEETKTHYENDIIDLKHTVQELNEKLKKSEINYHNLHEDYKKSQILVVEASHRESKMQQNYAQCSQEITEKLQASEAEESRIRDYARQLETQNNVLRNDLMTLQRQTELLKAQLGRLKSAASTQVNTAQEEINNLKTELNKVIQQHGKLKSENDSLRVQISHIQAYEQQNRVTGEQLDQCIRELHSAQADKQRLEIMNQKMSKEHKGLKEAFKNMDRDHHRLSQSVIAVEQDLAVTKSSRDEICLESQNVIHNVQNWVKCQSVINDQLKVKLRDNNLHINNLEGQLSYLETENCNCPCPCKDRQRGGSSRHTALTLKTQIQKSRANMEVQAILTPSSTFSNSTNDWYTYTDSDDESVQEIDLPRLWVRKVESITQELQKSNDYWRSQMLENDYMVTRDQ